MSQMFNSLDVLFETKSGVSGKVRGEFDVHDEIEITVHFDDSHPELDNRDWKEIDEARDNVKSCLVAVLKAKKDSPSE